MKGHHKLSVQKKPETQQKVSGFFVIFVISECNLYIVNPGGILKDQLRGSAAADSHALILSALNNLGRLMHIDLSGLVTVSLLI